MKQKIGFQFIIQTLLLLVLGVGTSGSASANIGEAFGFGASTMSLGGVGVAGGTEAYSTYHNPAALSGEMRGGKRLMLNYGIVWMNPSFTPISHVVTQNSYNSDKTAGSPDYGNVNTSDYRVTLGQEIGLAYRLLPELYNLTVGLTTFLPINQIAFMDTGSAYLPEYLMYRARTQRPQVDFGVGAHLGKGYHLGVGLNFAFSLTANASVFINTKSNSTTSMQFTSSVISKISPYLGFYYTSEENPTYSLGAVIRFPATSDASMALQSGAQFLNPLGAVDFNFNSSSALYYDPWALELGGSWEHNPGAKLYAQLDWQIWNQFQPPALLVSQSSGSITLAPGSVPAMPYQNTVVPRVGEEINLNDATVIRAGYAYHPSIFSKISNGAGNYLDPPKHVGSLGLGLKYKHFLNFEIPSRVDFVVSYHALMSQHITKTAYNEAGVSGDLKIGAPGYDAGGKLYGGGVTLSLSI